MKLIKRIPKSYKELNYKAYVAIINKIPSEKPEGLTPVEWSRLVHITTLCIILGVTEGEIEALQASEVMELIQAIQFLDKPIEPEKTAYRVKQINELTYDEFVTYQRLRLDQWNNLADILLLVLKDTTPEAIDAMSIHEVVQVFFCLKMSTMKFLIRLRYSTLAKAIIQKIKAGGLALLNKLRRTRS